MNVGELRAAIQDLDDDLKVHLAFNLSWPMEYEVDSVISTDLKSHLEVTTDTNGQWHVVDNSEDPQNDDYWVEGPYDTQTEAQLNLEKILREYTPVVYISDGEQIGYLPSEARKALGW